MNQASTDSASPLWPIYYSDEWKAWRDPVCPDNLDPTALLLDRHVIGGHGGRRALLCDDLSLDYATLLAETCRHAGGLVAAGCEPESRVLFFATDSVEFVATWLGAVRAGLIPAMVSDAHKAHHLQYFLEDTAASTLYIDSEQLPKLLTIADNIPRTLRRIIVRGSCESLTGRWPRIALFDAESIRARGEAIRRALYGG